jgi:hypothetical protein
LVVKEREFLAHASQEKGRFARAAKQAESVQVSDSGAQSALSRAQETAVNHNEPMMIPCINPSALRWRI